MLTFVSAAERQEILEYFEGRFGIPREVFDRVAFLREGKTVWAAGRVEGFEEVVTELRIETPGLPLLRQRGVLWKPTTAGLQRFGASAGKNVIELTGEALSAFLSGQAVRPSDDLEPGYVVVKTEGMVLGCGLYGRAGVKPQLPKPWGQAFIRGEEEG